MALIFAAIKFRGHGFCLNPRKIYNVINRKYFYSIRENKARVKVVLSISGAVGKRFPFFNGHWPITFGPPPPLTAMTTGI